MEDNNIIIKIPNGANNRSNEQADNPNRTYNGLTINRMVRYLRPSASGASKVSPGGAVEQEPSSEDSATRFAGLVRKFMLDKKVLAWISNGSTNNMIADYYSGRWC